MSFIAGVDIGGTKTAVRTGDKPYIIRIEFVCDMFRQGF